MTSWPYERGGRTTKARNWRNHERLASHAERRPPTEDDRHRAEVDGPAPGVPTDRSEDGDRVLVIGDEIASVDGS
jgi:hypothetical protein